MGRVRTGPLGWDRTKAKATPSYTLTLAAPGVETRPDDVLAFHLADAKQGPSPPLDEENAKGGARRRDQLAESLGALEVRLSTDDLGRIESAVPRGAAAGDRYPTPLMAHLDSERRSVNP